MVQAYETNKLNPGVFRRVAAHSIIERDPMAHAMGQRSFAAPRLNGLCVKSGSDLDQARNAGSAGASSAVSARCETALLPLRIERAAHACAGGAPALPVFTCVLAPTTFGQRRLNVQNFRLLRAPDGHLMLSNCVSRLY